MNIIGNICRQAYRKESDRLNILTFSTHERNQSLFSNINADFFMYQGGNVKDWNFTYAPLPKNHSLLRKELGQHQIPLHVDFDLVLSHNRFGQYQIALPLARALHVPLVTLEHTLPIESWDDKTRAALRQMTGNIDVFITENNRKEWGWNETNATVIRHALDTNVFIDKNLERKSCILTVANDFINRDYFLGFRLYQGLVEGLPSRAVGDTAGFSKPAKNIEELVNIYNTHSIYLNTAGRSPVPMATLEALSCGMPVVSVDKCELPYYIKHGVNGFLSNNPKELKEYLRLLLNDKELCQKMGTAARQSVLEKCSIDRFTLEWEKVVRAAVKMSYQNLPH